MTNNKFFRHGNGGYGRGGLKERTAIDPRRIMLASHMKAGAVPAHSVMPSNWLENYGVGTLDNHRYGNCTYAAVAHYINHIRLRDKRGPIIDAAAVNREYSKWTGFDPEIPSTDKGAYLLDVMKQWASDKGLYGTKIDAFAEVDGNNTDEVAFAASTMQGILGGFGLPLSIQDEPGRWEKTTDLPWSLGGHAMTLLNASPGSDDYVTWGYLQGASVPWRQRYWSEGYIVLLPEAMRDGRTFAGLDKDGLLAAVRKVRET